MLTELIANSSRQNDMIILGFDIILSVFGLCTEIDMKEWAFSFSPLAKNVSQMITG